MDYGKIFGGAWEITKRNKGLWVLGILAALGMGMLLSFNPGGILDDSFTSQLARRILPPEVVALIVAVSCLAFFLAIVIWVASVIARGGLIAGVQQVAEEGSTSFGQAWSRGAKRFWTLFGIGVLMLIALVVLIVIIGLVVGTFVWLLSLILSGVTPWLGFWLGGLLSFIGGYAITLVQRYAEQAAVQEGLGWTAAFSRGWQVLKDNVGPTIVLLFFFLGIGMLFIIVLMAVGMLVGVGAGAAFLAILKSSNPGGLMVASVCCGGVLALILVWLVLGIVHTFESAAWTLAYRQMTGLDAGPMVVEAPDVEEMGEEAKVESEDASEQSEGEEATEVEE